MKHTNISELISNLKERQKELECIYEISRILKRHDQPIESIMQNIIETIPSGFRFGDVCRVKLTIKDITIKHTDLMETDLKISRNIILNGRVVGSIQIYYIKSIKDENDVVFLVEEIRLIDTIVDEIVQYLTINHFREVSNNQPKFSDNFKISHSLSNYLKKWGLKESNFGSVLVNQISFNKDEVILKQGTKSSYMILLTEGLLKLSIGALGGRSFAIRICNPYYFVGLEPLFHDRNWDYSVSALINSKGFIIEVEDLKGCYNSNRAFRENALNSYSRNQQLLHQRIDLLANKQSLGRLSYVLLYLWKDIFKSQTIDTSITRKTIAELCGMSTENTIRVMSELKNEKLISTTKKGIDILNADLLGKYSRVG